MIPNCLFNESLVKPVKKVYFAAFFLSQLTNAPFLPNSWSQSSEGKQREASKKERGGGIKNNQETKYCQEKGVNFIV